MSAYSPHDLERFANAELVAASADLHRCREREIEASKAYIEAMDATTAAYEREFNARHAWFEASRKLSESFSAEESAP